MIESPGATASMETCSATPARRTRSAPAGVVAMTTGTVGSVSPLWWTGMSPLPVTITVVGRFASPISLRHAANAAADAGWTCSAIQRCSVEPRNVPAPTTTRSASARKSPMTNRSGSLNPLMSPTPGQRAATERHDPVDRRDEVGDDRRSIGAKRDREGAAVAAFQLSGHAESANLKAGVVRRPFGEDLEWRTAIGHGALRCQRKRGHRSPRRTPLMSKNSLRSAGSVS